MSYYFLAILFGILCKFTIAREDSILFPRFSNFLEKDKLRSDKSLLDSIVKSFQEQGIPTYTMKITESHTMKEPSKVCKNHIVMVQTAKSLARLEVNSLSVSTGKFAIVFGESIKMDQIEEILLQNDHFNSIIEIALFVPRGENVYSIFARSFENEKELTLLNVWNNGGYIWTSSVYPKGRMKNLRGTEIRATSFQYPPVNYKENPEREDEEYVGIETSLLKDISESLNFTYEIRPPSDGNKWGAMFENGSTTGLLRDVKNGYTDVAFANLFIYSERKKHIDYLQPYKTDYVCFLVKKPPPYPKWQDLMIPFNKETWYAILITLITCISVASIKNGVLSRKEFHPRDSLINIFAIFLDQSAPFCTKIKSDGLKFFIGCLRLMVYILTLSYKGSLLAVLSVTFSPKPIDRLEEIAAQDLPVGTFGGTFISLMEESADIDVQKIAEKSFAHYDHEAAFHNASTNKIIYAQSQQFLEYNLRKRFTNKFGDTYMHVTKGCFNIFNVAFAVPINSKYKVSFDRKLLQIVEAGLPKKYVEYEMDKAAKKAKSAISKAVANPLSINHLEAPLLLLPILLAFSLIVFYIEYKVGR